MKEYEKCFRKAESDLLTITNNFAAENIPVDSCCFHAQQAAEKHLKAYLTTHEIAFPKTHQLELLVKKCCEHNEIFSQLYTYSRKLEIYGVSPRYPDEMDDLTIEDAKQAYQNAIAIKDFVLTHFFE
jgi:HEPN domain-containing protein